MAKHNLTGKKGEILAIELLKSKGYTIIDCNKRFGKAEIDIIAKIGEEIVFVEVKTRGSAYFGYPEEAIHKRKIELMCQAAEDYSIEHHENISIRFDCISVILKESDLEIIHIEDAFIPGMDEF